MKKADAVPAGTKRALVARLSRIEGQVRGLKAMVEQERYCVDVLTQLSAVHESLRGVGRLLLRNHLEHCATNAVRSGDAVRTEAVWDEVTKLFYQHAR